VRLPAEAPPRLAQEFIDLLVLLRLEKIVELGDQRSFGGLRRFRDRARKLGNIKLLCHCDASLSWGCAPSACHIASAPHAGHDVRASLTAILRVSTEFAK